MLHVRRVLLLIAPLVLGASLHAQPRSKSGHVLDWVHSLQAGPADLQQGAHLLKGHAIAVHASTPRQVVDLWRADCSRSGLVVSGKDPLRATGAGLPGGATVLFASVGKGARKDEVRMVVAYAVTDSTTIADVEAARNAAYQLAVRLNRAVVQLEVNAQQKLVDKAAKGVGKAGKVEDMAAKRDAKAASELEKVKQQRARTSSRQADLEREQQLYQERYTRTQNPKDLEKLTKVQTKLVAVQRDMAKLTVKEANAQDALNKKAAAVPDARHELRDVSAEHGDLKTELEALKRKLEAVR